MKKIIFIILLVLTFTPTIKAYTERNLLEKAIRNINLEDILQTQQQWVKYPSYKDRTGWNNFLKKDKSTIIKYGKKYLQYKWQIVTASSYLEFERNGNRKVMEKPLNENIKAITSLFFGEMAEGKGRFIDQLINGIFYLCEMTSWSESAHLSALQLTHRSLPNYKNQVIDLGSGSISEMMSWIYYFLHNEFDKIDPAISERIYHEIKTRTLDTYICETRFWWMASKVNKTNNGFVNNWNPWCNSDVLQCFMLLDNDNKELAKAIDKTIISIDKYINYIKEDGACEEGTSYWGSAGGKLYDYLTLLSQLTNNKINIFNQLIIKNIGEYIYKSYVGDQWIVNFADALAKNSNNGPFIFRFGKAINSNKMMEFGAYLNKQYPYKYHPNEDIFRVLEYYRYKNSLAKEKAKFLNPSYSWYPQTQVCYIKDSSGLFFAAKGGFNNESHNHNDVGTFSLYSNNVPVIIDAGVGTYTRKTFSNERYSIWSMQSNYHNLPMINGIPQHFGSKFKATNVFFNKDTQTFNVDISKAYPAEAMVKKWNRKFQLKKNRLNIEESFVLTKAIKKNIINFMTWGKVNITKTGIIKININDTKVNLQYNPQQFTAVVETKKLDDPRFSNIWGPFIYRISLIAKSKELAGSYTYTITKN